MDESVKPSAISRNGIRMSTAEETIIPPPENVLKKMKDLALIGDIDGINEYVQQIDLMDLKYIEFCQRLKKLTAKYQVEEIIEMIDGFLKGKI